jgi:hypothetical protein
MLVSKHVLGLSVALMATIALPAVGSAQTTTALDPLHGYCSGGCIDNGVNSPTIGTPTSFGFTVSSPNSTAPQTGDVLIEILTPNVGTAPTSFSITGTDTSGGGVAQTVSVTASLFSSTAWTKKSLDQYLGISATPNNPIGAYLPSTVAFDPSATGFNVFQADLGTITLQDASKPNVDPLLNLGSDLPLASYIVAFLNEGTATNPIWVATANSGAIFSFNGTPLPGAFLLFGTVLAGGLGVSSWRKRRERGPVSVMA